MSKIILCANESARHLDRHHAGGLCAACYRWQARHGEPRPAEKIRATFERYKERARLAEEMMKGEEG